MTVVLLSLCSADVIFLPNSAKTICSYLLNKYYNEWSKYLRVIIKYIQHY